MTRRDLILGVPLLLSSGCGRSKGSGYSGYALIATSGEDSLGVVDLTAFRLLPTIPLGAPPTAVISAPSIGCSYVLTPSTNSVHVIDQTLSRVATHRLGESLSQIQLTFDNRMLLALRHRSRELIVAETGYGKSGAAAAALPILRRFKLDAEPVGFDISRTGYAAVYTSEPGVVDLFHLATGERTRARLPDRIGTLRFREDGKLLLAARPQDRSITALDVPSLRTVVELPLAMRPDNLCFGVQGGQLFVSGAGMDAVAIVFPYNTLVDQTLLAGRDPGVMVCSENPSYLFVASASGSDLTVVNVDTRKVIGVVEVGGKPAYLAITPDNQYALALNETTGGMAVIRIPAIRIINRTKSGVALFTILNVGSKPVHAAIMPRAV
jgi:YVTN family beta-propeller protein